MHIADDSSAIGNGGLIDTRQVLECWLPRPKLLSSLTVLMIDAAYKESEFNRRIIRLSGNGHVDTRAFQWIQRLAETSFLLAPSASEAYGHFVNQARATGAVVLTTGVAPMNELVPNFIGGGVLVHASRCVNPQAAARLGLYRRLGRSPGPPTPTWPCSRPRWPSCGRMPSGH